MTDMNEIVNSVAPITNVALMAGLIDRVVNRRPGLPGMGVFYGPSGFGKSTAAAFGANRFRAYVVEMRSAYTQKHLLQKIAVEMSLDDSGTIPRLHDRIAEQLAVSGRPLMVDEADFLVRKKMIEIVRDLYEASQGAVILIGEERFPAKIEQWERVHGRMLDFVAAEPVSEADARHLAKLYCPGVEIEDALFEKLRAESGPSARRMSVNLNYVRERAQTLGRSRMGVGDLKGVEFWNGRAPKARRFS